MPIIYSTLSNPQKYAAYKKGARKERSVIDEENTVRVQGRANVADSKFITVAGYKTRVSDHQLEMLMQNKVFLLHKENGYITIRNDDIEVEKVIKNEMSPRDVSAPVTPEFYENRKKLKDEDFKNEKGPEPVLNKKGTAKGG